MKLKTVLNIEIQVPKERENEIIKMGHLKQTKFCKETTNDMIEAIQDNIAPVTKMKITGKTIFKGNICKHNCPIRSYKCCWNCPIGNICKQACKLNPNECEKREME